jgi:hypothetical protein
MHQEYDLRLGRVLDIDNAENVVGESPHHRRGAEPAFADVPDAMQPDAVDGPIKRMARE